MKAFLLAAVLAVIICPVRAETVYRAMTTAADGRPEIANAPDGLGVRYGQMSENDIATSGGQVAPTYMNRPQGMAVTRGSACTVPPRYRPVQAWGGKNTKAGLALWSLDSTKLPAPLRLTVEDAQSGLIAPSTKVPVEDYTKALAGTAALWTKVDSPAKPCP